MVATEPALRETSVGRLEALRRLPEFAALGAEDLRLLLAHFDQVTVGAGQALAVRGAFAAQYLVVLDGVLTARDPNGCRELLAGDSAGWEEMTNRDRALSTIVATAPSRLLVMGRGQFRAARAAVTAARD